MHKILRKSSRPSLIDKSNSLTFSAVSHQKGPFPVNIRPPRGDTDESSLIISSPANSRRKELTPTSEATNNLLEVFLDSPELPLECHEFLNRAFDTAEPKFAPPEVNLSANVPRHPPADGEMLGHMIAKEYLYFPDPYWRERCQSQITRAMRAILLDWMMELCSDLRLKWETLHCAANHVDRYLSSTTNLLSSELQLVGVAALLLAAKLEEVDVPKVGELVEATNNAYSELQVIEMEQNISRVLFACCVGAELAIDTADIKYVG
eukprot:TRINITY_DN2835_c0_g4_i1.p1 TRINITY_DN2835_c0_g4~~TRINITY_DN2835_c0_g4_i1.p1  ORF type:complete len:264 (-),score=34.73 TRINITY_DN2835_c0_g4_i1:208-999(-)